MRLICGTIILMISSSVNALTFTFAQISLFNDSDLKKYSTEGVDFYLPINKDVKNIDISEGFVRLGGYDNKANRPLYYVTEISGSSLLKYKEILRRSSIEKLHIFFGEYETFLSERISGIDTSREVLVSGSFNCSIFMGFEGYARNSDTERQSVYFYEADGRIFAITYYFKVTL